MDLSPYYAWIVLVHVLAAFAFTLAHGVSAFVTFGVRAERDPARIRVLLELSARSMGVAYGSLLVLLLAGILAGIVGGLFGRLWIWASIVLLVAVLVAMYALASSYYARVRQAVGLRTYQMPKDAPDPTPLAPPELAALLENRRPELIALVGYGGLALLIWLMVMKPF